MEKVKMKIIIAGGRDITDYEIVRQAVVQSGYWKAYGKMIEVVSGTARGADQLGEELAEKNGLVVHKFPADWNAHGKAAGPIRNAQMGEFTLTHGGRLLALWDGKSVGTKNMIEWAYKHKLPFYVYRTDKPARYVKVGAKLFTDYSGKKSKHTVVEISKDMSNGYSQSNILFKLNPEVPKSSGGWFDADWFSVT